MGRSGPLLFLFLLLHARRLNPESDAREERSDSSTVLERSCWCSGRVGAERWTRNSWLGLFVRRVHKRSSTHTRAREYVVLGWHWISGAEKELYSPGIWLFSNSINSPTRFFFSRYLFVRFLFAPRLFFSPDLFSFRKNKKNILISRSSRQVSSCSATASQPIIPSSGLAWERAVGRTVIVILCVPVYTRDTGHECRTLAHGGGEGEGRRARVRS